MSSSFGPRVAIRINHQNHMRANLDELEIAVTELVRRLIMRCHQRLVEIDDVSGRAGFKTLDDHRSRWAWRHDIVIENKYVPPRTAIDGGSGMNVERVISAEADSEGFCAIFRANIEIVRILAACGLDQIARAIHGNEELVETISAKHLVVITAIDRQRVVPISAIQNVVALAVRKRVVSAKTFNDVVADTGGQFIVIGITLQRKRIKF